MFGRDRLKHENALLRETLGWYADLEHWRSYGIRVNARTGRVDRAAPETEWSSEATIDRGQRASFILRLPKPMPRVTVPACKE